MPSSNPQEIECANAVVDLLRRYVDGDMTIAQALGILETAKITLVNDAIDKHKRLIGD